MKKVISSGVRYCAFLWTFHVLSVASGVQEQRWSAVYKKIYTQQEQAHNRKAASLLFAKQHILPCSQLIIFSNIDRLDDSSFTLFVRAHTQGKPDGVWQEWHKVATWGDGIQKSYFSRGAESSFNYVRFEMQEPLVADGFEVKVVAKGATLDAVKALFVCCTDFTAFVPERPYLAGKPLASVYLQGVPTKSQQRIDHPRIGALCSPTTVTMMLEYLLGYPVDALETARGVYDEGLDVFGNWAFNMAYAFEKTEGRYYWYGARLHNFAQLHALLSQGMPVGVSVRGRIKGARKPYPNGHLLVVVGFDAKKQQVLCHDPAFDAHDQVAVAYDIAEFISAWERSYRLAYRMLSA